MTDSPTFADVLDLEEIDRDLYRSRLVFEADYPLYGGQVAAQALYAAGLTVPEGRLPHSLHGYFLRAGDTARPTVLRVERDRDGRSYSARRVVALQGGEVIFNMSRSFHVDEDGPDQTVDPPADVAPPDGLEDYPMPWLYAMEARHAAPGPERSSPAPSRLWARTRAPLPDALSSACALAYLSDISSGLGALWSDDVRPGSSLDHAVWLHRAVDMHEWVLMELVPHSVAGGRGWYTGSVHASDGRLVGSLAQEQLFRYRR